MDIETDLTGKISRSSERTVADGAAAALREMILEGALMPGARLHQDHLAEKLGLSRTPLRTALAALAQEGLILYEANRGYHVRRFSTADIREAFVVRANLEGLACRLAAEAGLDEATLDEFDRLVAEGDVLLSIGHLDIDALPAYRRMNVNFHEMIIAAAGNRWVGQFVQQTHNVPLVSDRVILWDDFEIIYRSHDDHNRIARALRDRDGVRAQNIMIEHVIFAGQLLAGRLESDPSSALKHAFKDKQDAATTR